MRELRQGERESSFSEQYRKDREAEAQDITWCYWCDRPRNDCACHLDPNGIPENHWSIRNQ